MPKDSLNLYISIQSGNSERTLTSLADKTRALDKEAQELKQTTEAFTKANKSLMVEQTRLQTEMKASQKVVNDLQKAYDEYGDELSQLRLDEAVKNHAKLKSELSEVNAQIGANNRTYKDYLETVRKGALGAGQSGVGLGGILSGASDFSKGHFYSELMKPLFSAGGELGEALLTSMIGTPEASLISGTLSNAISGGAAGAMFGPWGIAAGAALGGLSGLISGGTKIFEAKDDAFKDYYGGLYEDVSGRSGAMVESGSALASGREKDRISFKTLFGSEGVADDYLENMVDMANHTPFLYDDLVSMSKTLATYGYSPDERSKDYILDALQTIRDTGAALGLGTGDMTAVAQALGRMKSSDKTTLEYLNILNDRGIGAVGYLADYYGKSQGDIYGMISKGQISGTDAVEIITAALQDAYDGSMEEQSQTFAGITSTLEGLEQELQNAGGDVYNSLRQSGKSAMVDAYDGELGDAIKEINTVIGETQARRENLQDQYAREVLDAVLNGNRGELWSGLNEKQQSDLTKMHEEYVTALERYEASGRADMEAGAELEKLYETAQTMGQSYFDSSAEIQRLNEIEIDEITLIRENTAGVLGAVENIYAKTQEMSKGLASLPAIVSSGGRTAPTPDEAADAENALAAWRADPDSVSPGAVSAAQNTLADNMAAARRNAFGLARVPYDEYPALLHEGERVLTAAEARAQDAGGGQPVSITITGNSFTGMPEEMADQLAQIILQRLTEASIAAAPK